MPKFISFIVTILIGTAAFGLTGPANATLIPCAGITCDGQYDFDAGELEGLNSMFTIDNALVTAWMFNAGQTLDSFVVSPSLNDATSSIVLMGQVQFNSTNILFIELDGTFVALFTEPILFVLPGTYTTALKVPEPSTLLLFGAGLIGPVGIGWRRRRKEDPNNS